MEMPTPRMPKQLDRLALTILAHAILRIASSASGVLIGIYLANLSGHGFPVDARLLGALGAVSFAAELIALRFPSAWHRTQFHLAG